MGLPEIRILFQKKMDNAIRAGNRGMVAVLLRDDTKEQFLSPYKRQKEIVTEDWTADNLKLLQMVFQGGPQRVLAVRLKTEPEDQDLKKALEAIQPMNLDYLVYPGYTAEDKETVEAFLTQARKEGKKAKAVLPDCAADNAHVINFSTTSVTVLEGDATAEYTGAQYCCRIAGILAGLPLTQSCTYYELEEVVDCTLSENADEEVDAGKLIIVYDGEKYKLGRGVTSLSKTSETAPEDLKKIKIVEGMDIITNDIYRTFEDAYVGKVVNSYDNKQLFAGAVNTYLRGLEGTVLDATADNLVEVDAEANREYLEAHGINTEEMTDQELKEANTGSYLYLTGSCRFLDAMEDLTLQLYM